MISQAFSDIVFQCDGRLYVGSDLVQIATGDARQPAIFISPDFRQAFLMSFNDIGVLEVAPLLARELKFWVRRCRDTASAAILRKCAAEIQNTALVQNRVEDESSRDEASPPSEFEYRK